MQRGLERGRLWWWAAVCAIALAGLALRIVAARGGLWTDEAWSVIYAAQARDPLGVFLRINHDNNHHLYSLWLQAIGPGAPPLLARAPAIAAGTACVIVAALFAGRRSEVAGLAAALFFAVSPMLVVLGSEARGYAMMLAAALLLLLLVGDAVDGRPVRGAGGWLAALAVLGMFSHMTMAAPVAIAAIWFYLERRTEVGPRTALSATLRLMGPALLATAAVVVFVLTAGVLSPTGMRLGGYEPFSAPHFAIALNDLTLWSVGLGSAWRWIVPILVGGIALAIGVLQPKWLGSRARLYALLILAVPLGAGLVHAGNTNFARYYLTSAVGLLLLTADAVARGFATRPVFRAAALVLAGVILGLGLYRDSLIVSVGRGRPAAPVADMAALSPGGARIGFRQPRLKGVIAVAAEEAGYAARFAGGCDRADFLLAVQLRWSPPLPRTTTRCEVQMDAIDLSTTIPITGDSWVLYRAKSLAKPQGR